MCGIWCSYGFRDISDKQLEVVAHRGPDYHRMDDLGDGLFLGHTRLSIVDLDPRANQPMYVDEGSYSITYNGEIYNYVELKEDLAARGHRFSTTSDTEVLLRAYVEWGTDCLHRLNGMFAFVIYDKRARTLFVARDRFGIKPLYIYQRDGKAAVASEIKQFLTLEGFQPKANLAMAVDFISWRLRNHTSQTLYQDVYQLRGGQFLEIDLARPLPAKLHEQVTTWYSYTRLTNLLADNSGREHQVDKFRDVLFDSVRLRLRADVEIATCLSGGVDSSSLSCVMDEVSELPQSVFSSRNHDAKFDEYEYAEAVIQRVRTRRRHQVYFEYDDVFRQAEELTWFNDEPISSVSIMAQWNLFRSIHEHGFKIAISGQGADEVLGNYGNTRTYLRELLRRRKFLGLFSEIGQFSHGTAEGSWRKYLRRAASSLAHLIMPDKLYREYPSDVFAFESDHIGRNPHNHLAIGMNLDIRNSMRDYNIYLTLSTSLPFLLQYDDRTSMSWSVEERVPYLDYRLVELALSIPSDVRIRDGDSKYLLRESVRSLLPRSVYERRTKLGFATPQNQWFQGEFKAELLARVTQIASQYQIFDVAKVEDIAALHTEQSSSLLWRMIFFDIWAKKFNVIVQ